MNMQQPRSAVRRAISLLMAGALVAVLVTAGIAPVMGLTVNPQAAAPAAPAAFVPPVSTQFDVTGFLQAATLGGPGVGSHQGGTLRVNGLNVTVPAESIVILPANALSWQELFAQAPAPYGPTQTGMALTDTPLPPYTYEVHVVGNRIGDTYIAGLIDISQQGLNSGAGYINFINYATGEFRVGGTIGSSTTGARVQLNDPQVASLPAGNGRYGRAVSPDIRFTVDQDNPTVMAGTGFPMCIPRTNPAVADDPLCPQGNRPLDGAGNPIISIQMNDPRPACTNPPTNTLPVGCSPTGVGPATFPTAFQQAPMEVGDYVTFAGTLINDANGSYVSAHTVVNNAGIYTWPGTDPAYIMTDTTIIGTGGLTILGAAEASIRTRFEGMSTDTGRQVHLYGIDLSPATGATTDRTWGTIGVDPGPAGGIGAVQGRWRFRPPCDPFGTIEAKPDKACVMNPSGTFLPPTREVRAVIEGDQSQVAALVANDQTKTAANGLFYGQYHAPITQYIFPENVPGAPIVPNNFEAMDFVACGGYTSSAGTLAAQLNPWPGAVAPTCQSAPVANAGGPYTVLSGGTVLLNGTSTGSPPPTFAWAITNAAGGTFSPSAIIAAPTFHAPILNVGEASRVVNLSLTATNSLGTSTANTTVTVNALTAGPPTVNPVTPISVPSGTQGFTFTISGVDPTAPAGLTFTVTQAPAGTLTGFSVTQNRICPNTASPISACVKFNAPTVLAGSPAVVVTLTITAKHGAGTASAPVTTTVTVRPQTDIVTIAAGSTEYRTGKQRLIMVAGDVTAGAVLTLQPYVTTDGTIFTPPDGTFTNAGGGVYNLTLVGVPEPALPPATPLTVKSSFGGVSPAAGLDRIRA